MKKARLLIALSVALLLGACASTPARRIQEHPDIYSKATPQQQALISQGRIAMGFSPAFVRLALGAPDQVTQQTNANGTEVVWHYIDYQNSSSIAFSAFPVFPYYGYPYYAGFAPVIVQTTPVAHEWMRVVFKNHKVTAINQDLKN